MYEMEICDRGLTSSGGEIFRAHADRPRGPPSLLYNGYCAPFPGLKMQGRGFDTYSHVHTLLAPRLSVGGAVPLAPLRAYVTNATQLLPLSDLGQ